MAATKIADIISDHDVFSQYFINRSTELVNFYMGGIVMNDLRLDALATSGGKIVSMPFYNDLTGDSEILSDSSALTVNNVTTGQDDARLLARGKAWGVNDLATALNVNRNDPMAAIGDMVAGYWAREYQKALIQSLVGVYADNVANDSSDMVHDIAADDGSKPFTGTAFVDAEMTFGDAIGSVAGIAVHSKVYGDMKKADMIEFIKPSDDSLDQIPTYQGRRVIVNDNLPNAAATTGRKYTSILFGTGAVGFGNGAAPVPSETDRDSLSGVDLLITRSHFLMHPMGIKWTDSSVAGVSPTNAELINAANWDRVIDRKNVKIAYLVTN